MTEYDSIFSLPDNFEVWQLYVSAVGYQHKQIL